MTFWGGIVACSGPHLGVDHDARIWEDSRQKFPMDAGEWGLGDLAYDGCPRVLAGRKRPAATHVHARPWTAGDEFLIILNSEQPDRILPCTN